MPTTYDNSITQQFNSMNAGVIPNDVFGVAINWFVNRTPLTSRLPRLKVGSPNFLITNDNYRPRQVTLANGATLANNATTCVLADASSLEPGDVLDIESECVLVTAVNPGTNTITITRGYAGTTGATHADALKALLIGNTRTGAENEVKGLSRIPQAVTQYCQTVQHAYQVGGSLQANDNYVSAFATPLDRDRMLAIQHVMDDFEASSYYGRGVSISATDVRPMQKGLRTLLATNKTTSPTNAGAYKPADLIRDSIQKCFDNGGNPSIMLVSTDFLTAFALWGFAAMRIPAGANAYGTPIDLFEVPFLSGLSIIPAPLLLPGTAVCLSAAEARIRLKRSMIDKPRGSRGDSIEGDVIMEGAIEVDNEAHHAWIQGVTAFAA